MKNRNGEEHSSEELLELACRSDAVGRTGRNDNGNLADWENWSRSHPQRDYSVAVRKGREQWAEAEIRSDIQLSVVSWNILSDTWYQKEKDSTYTHTPEEYGEWEQRFRLLMTWLENMRPDIITLQEVDYVLFESHLLPSLRCIGYEGIIQKPKKMSSKQPCGNATFWASNKLHLMDDVGGSVGVFSRSLGTAFKMMESEHTMCVANVHLESAQTKEGANRRARQLKSVLAWAQKKSPDLPLIVSGDCNTGADSPLFAVLREHQWYGHDLASVYEHPSAEMTTPSARGTFAVPGHHYFIDQIWYSHESMRLDCLLDPLTKEEQDLCLGTGMEGGLPNRVCPSDHIPIGAIFTLSKPMDTTAKQAGIASAQMRLPSPEIRSTIEEKFSELNAQAPGKVKGKPTPEQIVEMKAHAALLKGWILSLPQEDQLYVQTLKRKKKRG
uniref:Endonuclease/exonuclease/phosphatase domain-containing protein n=1 Tax=Odontella aurita TaxID=265563 RepID=A0A7S4HQH1_9STRA|mmetsp:Transcript_13517/g.39449  ORF Transcript_13517/g.39449 Transcript_13517/m.39449 type:complete len:441 (+) Transcript_13517:103-1425(+)|eukprot:CAMPEP_0113544388 /NCGR_PEP_ID=MMETSP0015_2-20120614/10681_1 /TAXON_ID=2838 /ORGANISM="Odontella" /LENGTH=440 /DNA_ID=CAMNT_0000444643 /DNA_START=99 /DNA_END=1421 /DNA_ORIENTATION=- /assembly_acc=CAM_ASM_000160